MSGFPSPMRRLAAVVLAGCVLLSAACGRPARTILAVKGSDSEVNVVQQLAEAYMARHPGVFVSVGGGGSGTGIAAILDGTADVANSSRALTGLEILRSRRHGRALAGFVFATDALAVVVHADNPVSQLDLATLGALYRGETARWPDGRVASLYGRQSNSGTYAYFREVAVKGEYAASLRQMNGSAQIVEAVRQDRGGIGYVAAGYVEGERAAGLRVVPLVSPVDGAVLSPRDAEAVRARRYPLARPLHQFVAAPPDDAVRAFLTFEASPEGRAIVARNGFFPVAEEDARANDALLGG